MIVSCSIHSWSSSKKPLFLSVFSSDPTGEDVQEMVRILPELEKYKADHVRLVGLYDLQGHKPANPLSIILRARSLLKYRKVLESIVVLNTHRDTPISDILQQINLFANHAVYVIKKGTPEQTKLEVSKIAKKDKELAALVQDYLDQASSAEAKKRFKVLKDLTAKA